MSAKKQETSSIDLIAGHFTRVEQKMDQKFEQIDERFELVDQKMNQLELRLSHKIDRNHSELVSMLDQSIRNSDRLDKERVVHSYRLDRIRANCFRHEITNSRKQQK